MTSWWYIPGSAPAERGQLLPSPWWRGGLAAEKPSTRVKSSGGVREYKPNLTGSVSSRGRVRLKPMSSDRKSLTCSHDRLFR